MVIQKLPTDFQSRGVDLSSVLVWAIREQQLYTDRDSLEFNIKLDGRPLGGVLIEIILIILLLSSNNIMDMRVSTSSPSGFCSERGRQLCNCAEYSV